MNIKTFGPVDERSLKQLQRCMSAGDAEYGVLCADHHPGYSQPIGGAIAYEGYVSPSGVGFDVGCGNKAVQTELTRTDLEDLGGVEAIMDQITRRISFGMGVPARERVDHPVLDHIRNAEFAPQRKLAGLAESQLGTVGSGNHYVNLMEDEGGHVWVGVHFGSRGFGHKTASGFLALAQGLAFDGRAQEGEMDSPPVLLEIGTELGEAYIAAMQLAGAYAYAGRDVVVAKVLEVLSAEAVHEVHNHHNFAWREEHGGRTYWVIRKGCTPARPGQEGFVGGSMGDESVILQGVASDEATESLFSTVHGAGRVMSRTRPPARCGGASAGRAAPATVTGCSSPRTPPVPSIPARACSRPGSRSRSSRAWSTGPPSRHGCATRASCSSAVARRGAGGLQAPARRALGSRRVDQRDPPAAAAGGGHGGARHPRSVQGLRAPARRPPAAALPTTSVPLLTARSTR